MNPAHVCQEQHHLAYHAAPTALAAFLTHELVAKTALGISLDEQPRWG